MTAIVLPVGALIKLNSIALSEHNRNPMSIGYNRIEKLQRMSNGTLRKFFVVDKKTLNVSWDNLPSYSNYTVDNAWGALDIKNFYESYLGKASFPVTISYSGLGGMTTETMNMYFTSFSCDVVKRNVYSEIDYKKSDITAVTHNGSTITYTGANSFAAGEVVSVSGFDTELYNVSSATVASANSTSFTVTKSGSTASVTEASSNGSVFTYYATNTFTAGDVVSISGFKTATITGATTSGGKITYTTSTAHGFANGDMVNITGISNNGYNLSNALVSEVTDTTFKVVGTEAGSATFSGASASSVYNKTNVDVVSATDYYFTVASTASAPTVVLTSNGTATLYSEATQFSVTAFVPTLNTNVKYTASGHDLEVGDRVSISGIRSTATVTNAFKLTGSDVIPYQGTVDAVKLEDNVATVYFSDSTFGTYPWNIGDSITISDCSNTVFNGTYTITAVPTNFSVSFAKTNANIPLDSEATGNGTNNTWASGMIRYTATNTFVRNDIVSITGITPSEYNNSSARIAYATSSYFLVPGNITVKYRKPGSASSVFNLSNVQISAVDTNTFTVPFAQATGSSVSGLSGVTVSKYVEYTAYARTVATPQEFWSLSFSLEEI